MSKYFPSLKVFFWSDPSCYFQHQPLQRVVILPISVSSNHRMNLSSVPQHLSKMCSYHTCVPVSIWILWQPPPPPFLTYSRPAPPGFPPTPLTAISYFPLLPLLSVSSLNMGSPELCPQPSWHSPCVSSVLMALTPARMQTPSLWLFLHPSSCLYLLPSDETSPHATHKTHQVKPSKLNLVSFLWNWFSVSLISINGIHIYSGIQTQSLMFDTSQGLPSPVDLPLNFFLVSSLLLLPLQLP